MNSSRHSEFISRDYARLKQIGIATVRLSARWHLIERAAGFFEFDSLEPFVSAAENMEMEIVLDLLHFGWPDHIDVFSPQFPDRFADFTGAAARFFRSRGGGCRFFAPLNEISFLSWAGGDVAAVNPYEVQRGDELKRNLIRAAAKSSRVLLDEIEDARLIAPEPVIHIVGNPAIPGDDIEARHYTLAQYQAWDMLSGRANPELGGRPEYLDIIGVNFYPRNEWEHNSKTALSRSDPRYRAFRDILHEVWQRYRRPIFVAETGTEDDQRAEWFNYICEEVIAARRSDVPVHGICVYPILNHPGWEDDRHCHNGLFDYADDAGDREIYQPLADAIENQSGRLPTKRQTNNDQRQYRPHMSLSPPLGLRVPTATASDEPFRAPQESFLF